MSSIRRTVFAIALMLGSAWQLAAQNATTSALPEILVQRFSIDRNATDTSSHLDLNIDLLNYLRDAEYFLPFSKGYTATGWYFSPFLSYNPTVHTSLRAGLTLAHIAGTHKLHGIKPLLSFEYHPNANISLTLGSLSASCLRHNLPAALYDPERCFHQVSDYAEDGVQILTNFSHWKSDTWLNWENYLYPFTPEQERFTLASAHRIVLLAPTDGHNGATIEIPLVFVGRHQGGQFTTLDTNIESLFNQQVALTVGYSFYLHEKNIFKLTADFSAFFFQNVSPTPTSTPYTEGHAFLPTLTATWRHTSPRQHIFDTKVQLGMWHGERFIAPNGSYLYQSRAWHNPSFTQAERNMITASAVCEAAFKTVRLGANVDIFHDRDLKKTDIAFGLYARTMLNFRLLTVR